MHWREVAPGPANDTELLLCALVLCGSAMSKEDAVKWADDVLVEAPRLQELGSAWTPLRSYRLELRAEQVRRHGQADGVCGR